MQLRLLGYFSWLYLGRLVYFCECVTFVCFVFVPMFALFLLC
jgi:hypothetical protein